LNGRITTIAGTGSIGYSGDGGPALNAIIGLTYGIAVGAGGNIYMSTIETNVIRKLYYPNLTWNLTTILRRTELPPLPAPVLFGIAVDSVGDIIFALPNHNRIYKLNESTRIITVIAGTGDIGDSGDGGPAVNATLDDPHAVAIDSSGDIYVADTRNDRIRKIDKTTGAISLVSSAFSGPRFMRFDSADNLYVSEPLEHRVRKLTRSNGLVSTIAGTGSSGYSGDGGLGGNAQLNRPGGIGIDSSGNIYIVDRGNFKIRKVDKASGIISSLGEYVGTASPVDILFDSFDNMYTTYNIQRTIRFVNIERSESSIIAGNQNLPHSDNYSGPAAQASLAYPLFLALAPNGTVYFTESSLDAPPYCYIRKLYYA
jgi:hypothetical protein